MREPVHTDKQIVDAGLELRAEGIPVNGWALRKRLGDTGRPERLATVWKKWLASELQTPAPTLPEELKSGLAKILASMSEDLELMFARLYQEASDQAKLQTEELEAALASAGEQFERESAAANSELERLEALLSQRDQQLAQASEQAEGLKQQLASASNELNLVTERLKVSDAALQRSVAEGAVTANRCEELKLNVQDQGRKLASETQRANDLEVFSKRLDADLTKSRAETSAANGRESMLAGQLSSLREQLAAEVQATGQLRVDLKHATDDLTEKNVLLKVAQENEAQLRGDLKAAVLQVEEMQAQLLKPGRDKS